ncbi:olfactory receptor 10A7-like [Mantella aurantiaca]
MCAIGQLTPTEIRRKNKTMNDVNITITEFFFLGFPGLGGFKILFFLFTLLMYTVTVLLDIMIVVLVSTQKSLNSPMYFFLKNFILAELFLVTLVVPNMLRVIWLDGATISIPGCLTQIYFYCASGTSECYLLAVMSYDRYLAICKPLHYHIIMDHRFQNFLIVFCWVFGFLLTLITFSFLLDLKFCSKNAIDHYFCDLSPFVDLACSDTAALQIDTFVMSFPHIAFPFILVVVSYVCISIAIIRMTSILSRKKAFSTCSTHLTVVSVFYGTLLINYLIPKVNGQKHVGPDEAAGSSETCRPLET